MKKTMIFFLIFCSPLFVSAVEITPPDMDLGHWVTTVDSSAMMKQMLANVPEESRAMVEEMMKKQMQESSSSEQCITQEILESFDKQMETAFSREQDCDFNISESTSEKFVADFNCPGSSTHIVTNVINSKRSESLITTQVDGMDKTTITSVSEWKSAVCPEGI
ncbi:MAG: DUF3617 domain-containing protein [Gammaproteobacteria bacterium]